MEQLRHEKSTKNDTLYKSYADEVYLEENYNKIINAGLKEVEIKLDAFFTTSTCFYIYSSIIALVIVITIMRSITFYTFCMSASVKMHNSMFERYGNSEFR